MRKFICFFLVFCANSIAWGKAATIKTKAPKEPSSFFASLGASYQSSFETVETGKNPQTFYEADVGYRFSSTQEIGFTPKYYHEMVSTAEDTYAGMLDSTLSFRDFDVWRNKKYRIGLGYMAGVTLPTSQASQFAGLRLGPWFNLLASKKTNYFKIKFSNLLGVNSYKYDTADLAGTQSNISHYWFSALQFEQSFGKKDQFKVGVGGANMMTQDYQKVIGRNYNIFMHLGYEFQKKYAFQFMVASQDRRSENTNLFMYDKVFWTLGFLISV